MTPTQETIRIPIRARMEQQPDGSYRMAAAEYAELPLDAVARVFYQAYRADQQKNRKGELTA